MSSIDEGISRTLVELKNKAELMIDLAYSAIMLRSREIAEEVIKLEEYFDWIHSHFQMQVLTLYTQGHSRNEILGLLKLSTYLENIADSAARIAEAVLTGLEMRHIFPILRPAIESGEEFVSIVKVHENSPLVNKPLGKALEDVLDIQVLAIRRGDEWFFNPSGDFILKAGDILIVRGYSEALDDIRKITKTTVEEIEEIEERFFEESEEEDEND